MNKNYIDKRGIYHFSNKSISVIYNNRISKYSISLTIFFFFFSYRFCNLSNQLFCAILFYFSISNVFLLVMYIALILSFFLLTLLFSFPLGTIFTSLLITYLPPLFATPLTQKYFPLLTRTPLPSFFAFSVINLLLTALFKNYFLSIFFLLLTVTF